MFWKWMIMLELIWKSPAKCSSWNCDVDCQKCGLGADDYKHHYRRSGIRKEGRR